MWNADGSPGEMCGNGVRCVGKYVYERGLARNNVLTIETAVGVKHLKLTIAGDRVERFASPAAGVEVFSYRADLAGALPCGPRNPPDRVYITVHGEGPALRIVAIEFLEK